MVSVFDGQLSRTWFFESESRRHVINLYHDTITGVRSILIDFQEVPGTSGISPILMDSKGHKILFNIDKHRGYIIIKRSGWSGFKYSCFIDDIQMAEATETVSPNQEEVYKPKVVETINIPDEISEGFVTWYLVRTKRLTDNLETEVYRRFRDFSELNSQIKQNFKGHHLRQALPPMPEKPLKSFTDHNDPAFIKDRMVKLDYYISSLVSIPHVNDMVCIKAFLGMMEQVREFSISFSADTLGLSLVQGKNPAAPAIVGSIQRPELCAGVHAGDTISKINGVPVNGLTFSAVVARIRSLPRPIIIHFIQVTNPNTTNGLPTTAAPAVPSSSTTTFKPTKAPEVVPQQTVADLLDFGSDDISSAPTDTSNTPQWNTFDATNDFSSLNSPALVSNSTSSSSSQYLDNLLSPVTPPINNNSDPFGIFNAPAPPSVPAPISTPVYTTQPQQNIYQQNNNQQVNQPLLTPLSQQPNQPLFTPQIQQTNQPLFAAQTQQPNQPLFTPQAQQPNQPLFTPQAQPQVDLNQPLFAPQTQQPNQPLFTPQIQQTNQPLFAPQTQQSNQPLFVPQAQQPNQPLFTQQAPQPSQPLFTPQAQQPNQPLFNSQYQQSQLQQPIINQYQQQGSQVQSPTSSTQQNNFYPNYNSNVLTPNNVPPLPPQTNNSMVFNSEKDITDFFADLQATPTPTKAQAPSTNSKPSDFDFDSLLGNLSISNNNVNNKPSNCPPPIPQVPPSPETEGSFL